MVLTQWETLCGLFFAFFEKIVVPILTSGGLAAVSSSAFAALYSAFGKYDVVHIHAEGPAFFAWLPKMFGKRVVVTVHGIDWQREKWQSGLGSKFIHQGEKNAAKYACVYLIHNNNYFNDLVFKNIFINIPTDNVIIFILCFYFSIASVYATCTVIELLRIRFFCAIKGCFVLASKTKSNLLDN